MRTYNAGMRKANMLTSSFRRRTAVARKSLGREADARRQEEHIATAGAIALSGRISVADDDKENRRVPVAARATRRTIPTSKSAACHPSEAAMHSLERFGGSQATLRSHRGSHSQGRPRTRPSRRQGSLRASAKTSLPARAGTRCWGRSAWKHHNDLRWNAISPFRIPLQLRGRRPTISGKPTRGKIQTPAISCTRVNVNACQ